MTVQRTSLHEAYALLSELASEREAFDEGEPRVMFDIAVLEIEGFLDKGWSDCAVGALIVLAAQAAKLREQIVRREAA